MRTKTTKAKTTKKPIKTKTKTTKKSLKKTTIKKIEKAPAKKIKKPVIKKKETKIKPQKTKKTILKKIESKIKKHVNELTTIKELTFNEMIPMSFDDVVIHSDDGIHSLTIASYFTKDKLKLWFKGRGGIFSKDYRKFLKEDSTVGKYMLIKDGNEKLIIRIIEDEQLEDFKVAKFVDGKIGDKSYMIFKKLSKTEKITSTHISDVDENIHHIITDEAAINDEGEVKILFDPDTDSETIILPE
jgi:hypothetical protein